MSKCKWSQRRRWSGDRSSNKRGRTSKANQRRPKSRRSIAYERKPTLSEMISQSLRWALGVLLGSFVFLWVCSEAFPLLAANFTPEVLNSHEKFWLFLPKLRSQYFREQDVSWSVSFPPNVLLYFFILLYTFLCLAVKVEVRMDGYICCDCFLSTGKVLVFFFQLLQEPCNFLKILVLWKDFLAILILGSGGDG